MDRTDCERGGNLGLPHCLEPPLIVNRAVFQRREDLKDVWVMWGIFSKGTSEFEMIFYICGDMQIITDNAFIFFKRSIQEVYDWLDDPTTIDPTLPRRDFITIHPTDIIKQTSNSDVDINFGTDYYAYLVTGCGEVLADITEKVDIFQFTNSQTGIRNIHITLANIGLTFGDPVHLKLVQSFNSSNTFFSNPFHLSENIADTTMYYYRDYATFDDGADYLVTDAYNYIRAKARFTNYQNDTPVQTYRDDNGNMKQLRSSMSLPQRFVMEYFDNHGFSAFSHMLQHSVVYAAKGGRIIGERVTSFGNPEAGEVEGSTNFYVGNVQAYVNRREVFDPTLDVTIPFALLQTGLIPLGSYTVAGISTVPIEAYFNKNITVGTGTVTVTNTDTNTLVLSYTEADIALLGTNGFTITNFIGQITAVGNYSIKFTSGLFSSPINETIPGEWLFRVTVTPDWKAEDWNGLDFYTAE